jgi:phosphoglycerol transferase
LKQIPDRSIFNLFIAKDLPRKNRETLVHFDLFPTILDFIGIHVQNARMGLGYSGFSQTNPRLDLHRLMDMRRDLPHPSPLYFALWKQPAETVTPPDTKSTRYL